MLTCPNDKQEAERLDFDRVKNPEGTEELLTQYRGAYKHRNAGLQTIDPAHETAVGDLDYGLFYVRPPKCSEIHPENDQDYANATSIAFYLSYGNQSILIPGDITPDTFELLLDDKTGAEKRYSSFDSQTARDWYTKAKGCPSLGELLRGRGLSLLVAQHHGLESGFCHALYSHIRGGKPLLNVISEKRHLSDVDGTVDARYQSGDYANGLTVDVEGKREARYSVSTRDGHHVLIVLKGGTDLPSVYLRSDPEDLLNIVP